MRAFMDVVYAVAIAAAYLAVMTLLHEVLT